MSAGAGMGPRIMVSRAALDRTGLLALGSRASERLLIKLPAQSDPVAVRKQVETALPDAQVMDFKEGNPALSQGLDNATAILSLICLVAMVLGAIGVDVYKRQAWRRLEPSLAEAGAAHLRRVRVYETPEIFAEYRGEA